MNRKKILCAVLAAVVTTGALWAQASTPKSPESNTHKGTAGAVGTDVDNFVSTRDFGGVEFDKAFLYGQVDSNDIDFGYAMRFGTVYVGAYYTGGWTSGSNIFRSADTTTITTHNVATAPLYSDWTETTKSVSGNTALNKTKNQLDALVGLALGFGNLGIKLGFFENLEATETPYYDIARANTNFTNSIKRERSYLNGTTETSEVTDYKYLYGTLTPKLAVGTVIALGNLKIKPELTAEFAIVQDAISYKQEGTTGSPLTTTNGYTTGTTGEWTRDHGYFEPKIGLDVGVDLAPTFGVGLGYSIAFRAYNGKGETQTYSTTNVQTSNATTYQTQSVDSTIITERTNVSHIISPSVWWSKDVDERLKIGASGKLPMTIGSTTAKSSSEVITTSQTQSRTAGVVTETAYSRTEAIGENLNGTETTSFDLAPEFKVGMRYQIVQNKFALNAGVGVSAFTVSNRNVLTKPAGNIITTTYDAVGVTGVNVYGVTTGNISSGTLPQQYDDRQTNTSSFAIFSSASLPLGFTLNVTEKFTIDALTVIGTNGGDITNFSSLLFTLKF